MSDFLRVVLADPLTVTDRWDKSDTIEKSKRPRIVSIEDDGILWITPKEEVDHAVVTGICAIKLAVITANGKC
jgi:hypothetical protein